MKIDVKNLSTPDLLAFLNLFENLYTGSCQLVNSCTEFVEQGARIEQFQDIAQQGIRAKGEQIEIVTALQKEMDLRIKKNFGAEFGLRKMQSILVKLEDRLLEVGQQEVNKLSEEHAKLKIEPKDDNNTNPGT